ncbi:MAG: DUF1385 domain-containing protein [Oscillospiraceae bacterium]|nr:DUF1385 domain-containing protein [Oscillospiraceae bacterium]
MMAEKKISIGGQALMEGIMMKGPESYSIAVRKPTGDIDIKVEPSGEVPFAKVPILRGIASFFTSLSIGYKSLMRSAEISMADEAEDDFDRWVKEHFGEKAGNVVTGIAGFLGAMLRLVLFMVLPTALTGLLDRFIPLGAFKALIEGLTKMAIFFLYLYLVSRMKEIRRVFEYHGAEHKTIHCFESGEALTVENVRKHTRFHPRCGTSFLFIVLAVSIVIFSFVPWKGTLSRALLKVLFLPVVVGVAYEILRYTGTHDNAACRVLARPGLWFQRLTTREPDDSMIEVAIASVNAILPETAVTKTDDAGDRQ